MTRRGIRCAIAAAIALVMSSPFAQQRQVTPVAPPPSAPVPSAPEPGKMPAVPPLPQGMPQAAQDEAAELRGRAVGAAVSAEMPLTPDEIKDVNKKRSEVNRARMTSPGEVAPKPANPSVAISLAPGRPPHVLRLARDTVTSVVFSDITGAPWPIASVETGSKDQVRISFDTKAPTNVMSIAPSVAFASSNISVLLVGAPAPIVMTVLSDGKFVDYRVDLAVQARGPAAAAPLLDPGYSTAMSKDLISALDGVPPIGSRALTVSGADAQAWLVGGSRILVRSRLQLLSPAALKAASSVDGTKVYEIPEASVILFSAAGRPISATIDGFPTPSVEQVMASRRAQAQ